ncbi:MAG: DUF397 domain-containing protein [Actinophytocola sp.]|nr:DUF397 domain-containing protein [Actinophytocola sp.]
MHPSSELVGKVGIRVDTVYNGMPAEDLSVAWRKSKRSGAVGNCVEVARLSTGEIAMRNSRFPTGPALVYTEAEIAAFLAGAKDGEFDDVIG